MLLHFVDEFPDFMEFWLLWNKLSLPSIQVLIRALIEIVTLHLTNREHRFALDVVETSCLFVHRATETFDYIFATDMALQMVLWSMAKSPLMYGGDLRHLDDTTFNLITHPTLLKINHHSKNNIEVTKYIQPNYPPYCNIVNSKLTEGYF